MKQFKDYYWLNKDSKTFLSNGYCLEDQTVEDKIDLICNRAEKYLKIKGFADKFKSYIAKGYYSLSSPVWANYGEKRGLPVSCFNSHIPDSITEIFDKISEVGIMTKMGGGTSGYFGAIRPRGSEISVGGKADGPIRFMELFDLTTTVTSQGSVRRGAFAAYLPVEHPDILEFLEIKSLGNAIQDMHFAVTITDKWMEEMLDGDKQKRKVWGKIIKKRYECGEPYVVFIDNANNNKPQVYKDKGMRIHGSNVCVTGDQRVVSNFGLLTAKELYDMGEDLILFDNNKKVKSSPMQLIERDAEVYKITLDNGMSHTVTAHHKIVTSDYDKNHKENELIKECKDLKVGDRVAVQTNKGVFGNLNMPREAFLLGIYQSDGTQHKDIVMFDVWENDFDLLDEIQSSHNFICDVYKTQISSYSKRQYNKPQFHECQVNTGSVRKKRLASKACKKALNFEKGYVPSWIFEANEETQWQYVKGLLYADGTVFQSSYRENGPIQIAYADINKDFLSELQILFANLGLQSSIRLLRKGGETLLPDGKGGKKYYETKDCWRLIVGNKNDALEIEKNTKFLSRKNIKIEDREYRNNTKKYYQINSIEKLPEKEDVYCVKVDSDSHLWVCNGFITHNCSEIFLPSNEDESFVCVLSSLNLMHWDEMVKTDAIETLIYFLDTVNEEFVIKTEGMKHMEAPHNFAKRHRALGMGVLGWYSYLQNNMIPFESMEAKQRNNIIFKTIRERADKATEELANKFGEPEVLKGTGRRNTTTMAIAPTTSSAHILGQISQGIEPLMGNYYVKKLAKGKFTYRNPVFKELLKKHGQHNEEVWSSVLAAGGSCQHLDFLSDIEKATFKTWEELSQKEILIQASQRQKYIDQGQSLNVLIHPDVPAKQTNTLMIDAWKLGIKALYYQRSNNPSQEVSRNLKGSKKQPQQNLLECVACEG